MKQIVISLTTIPRRFDFLKETMLPNLKSSIIEVQERLLYDFDMNLGIIVITIDDNLSTEDKQKYKKFADEFNSNTPSLVLVIQESPSTYRCINKEVGGRDYCAKYDYDAFITVDDDQIYNDSEKLYDLCKYHASFPNEVICIETNPVVATQDGINIICGLPPKVAALKSHSKILSNFCLFPAKCFEGTRLDDIEYIKAEEWNRHDELFVWAELTRKGVESIVLPNTYSLAWDNFDSDFTGDEKGLRDYNSEHWNDWTVKINKLYTEFKQLFNNETWTYIVEDKNAFAVAALRQQGYMNGMAAHYGKILTYDTRMIRSDSYKKFMYR